MYLKADPEDASLLGERECAGDLYAHEILKNKNSNNKFKSFRYKIYYCRQFKFSMFQCIDHELSIHKLSLFFYCIYFTILF